MTPWTAACLLPSHHGLPVDVVSHLEFPGVVISTPDFFLVAHTLQVELDEMDNPDLLSPFTRAEPGNAWCLSILTGDMVSAYRALVAVGGEKKYLAWQDRRGGYRWRRTGPAFNAFLQSIQRRKAQSLTREADPLLV